MHSLVVVLLFLAVTSAGDVPSLLGQFMNAFSMYIDRQGGVLSFDYDFGDGMRYVTGENKVKVYNYLDLQSYDYSLSGGSRTYSLRFGKNGVEFKISNCSDGALSFESCKMEVTYAADPNKGGSIAFQRLTVKDCGSIYYATSSKTITIHAQKEMYLGLLSQALSKQVAENFIVTNPTSKNIKFEDIQSLLSDGVSEVMRSNSNPYLLSGFVVAFNDYLTQLVETFKFLSFDYNFGNSAQLLTGQSTVYIFYGLKLLSSHKEGNELSLVFSIDGPAFKIKSNQHFMQFAFCEFGVAYKKSATSDLSIVLDNLIIHNCRDMDYDNDPVVSGKDIYENLLSQALFQKVNKYFEIKNWHSLTFLDLQKMFSDAMYEAVLMSNSTTV